MKTMLQLILVAILVGAAGDAVATERQVVREIYFRLDRADILPAARPVLHEVAELLLANPDLKVHIAGYTCDLAADDYNLRLSRRRADAAQAYLVRIEGVARDRITETSFGEARPAYPNTSEAMRAKNRRVVLTMDIPAPLPVAAPAPTVPPAPAMITRTVTATVVDAAGNFIPDLPASRFTVREAGGVKEIVRVSYTMEPLRAAAGLLLDVSPSNCRVDLRDALHDFLGRANPATRWYAVACNQELVTLSNFTADRDMLLTGLPLRARAGGTRLYDGVASAAAGMAGRPAPRYLVVLSDGVDEAPWPHSASAGSAKTLEQAAAACSVASVKLVSIELGPTPAAGREALRQLARRTGGMSLVWDRDAGAGQFAAAHRLITAGGLSGRYTIEYRTVAGAPGGAVVDCDAGAVR